MFCIYLRTNSDLCHLQHKLIGFYNRDEKCLQRGKDWAFKYSSLSFVFKGLRSFLKLSCHLCLVLPSRHFPSDIHTAPLYGFLLFPIHAIATCCSPPHHKILHDLISQIIFGEFLYNVNQQITFRLSAPLCSTVPFHPSPSRYMNTIHTWPNAEVSVASPSWWWRSDEADCYDSGLLAASSLEGWHTRYLSVKEWSKMRPRLNYN